MPSIMSPWKRSPSSTDEATTHSFWEWSWLAKEGLLDDGQHCDQETRGSLERDRATTIAACFLRDYEAGRPPTFAREYEHISDAQLRAYRTEFSTLWRWIFLYPATLLMFVSFYKSRAWTTAMHLYAVAVFLKDLRLKESLHNKDWFIDENRKMELFLHRAMMVFLVALGLQSCVRLFLADPEKDFSTLAASLLKPLVFFYLSQRARDALEALSRIAKILARVILIELFLILAFAAVACRLYYNDEHFGTLAVSWLSLFQLSTTVVNPSLWMPIYSNSRSNAIFFVFFIVVCVFYLHSLILSVVFQVFIQAATEVHERSAIDKENSIRYAFAALSAAKNAQHREPDKISTELVKETIAKVRPHYGEIKIDILMGMMDPQRAGFLDIYTFRTNIIHSLGASIRSSKKPSMLSNAFHYLSILVTIVNFLYVILLTSKFQAGWFTTSVVGVGSLITLFCVLELGIRVNICTLSCFPMTRVNSIFDGFAAVGAVVSCYGIVAYAAGKDAHGLDCLFAGRSIDMIRMMRFFRMFRDIVERSVNVLPALAGPVFLVLSTIHTFVYFGMALWCGQVDTEQMSENEDIEDLFYLNNFNSYSEGLVTVFNVLVINDWHEISKVFLYADQHSHPLIVYPYFVTVVLIAVFIMLNVITAFFVETFVTRLTKDEMESDGVIASEKAQAEVSVASPRIPKHTTTPKLLDKQFSLLSLIADDPGPIMASRSTITAGSGEELQFDVFERQDFDRIMQSVGNSSSNQDEVAKSLCETVEFILHLASDRYDCEVLIYCRSTINMFHTSKFNELISEFQLADFALQDLVEDLIANMEANEDTQTQNRISKHFEHRTDRLKELMVSAQCLPRFPGLTLVVAQQKCVLK